jgi:hypothetical protein
VVGRAHEEAGRGVDHGGKRARFGLTGHILSPAAVDAGRLRIPGRKLDRRWGFSMAAVGQRKLLKYHDKKLCFCAARGWFAGPESAI